MNQILSVASVQSLESNSGGLRIVLLAWFQELQSSCLRISNPTSSFIIVVTVLLLSLLSFPHCFRSRNAERFGTREKLQALLSVITPTQSRWSPVHSISFIHAATPRTIALSFENMLQDICMGMVELRDPQRDLPEMIHSEITAYGWAIRLDVDKVWWFRALSYIALSRVSFCQSHSRTCSDVSYSSITRRLGFLIHSRTNSSHNATKISLYEQSVHPNTPILFSSDPSTLCLDYVHHAQLLSFIRDLKNTVMQDTPAILEFTALGHSVKFPDKSFILCTLPLLPCKHIPQNQYIPQCTSIPLFISLPQIVQLLSTNTTSGNVTLAIKSVQNVSENYVVTLNAIATALQDHRSARESFIVKWGVKAWREHIFWKVWEAALFKVGFLQRWVIVVQR